MLGLRDKDREPSLSVPTSTVIIIKNIFCMSIWREFLCPEQVKFFGFLTCSFHKV